MQEKKQGHFCFMSGRGTQESALGGKRWVEKTRERSIYPNASVSVTSAREIFFLFQGYQRPMQASLLKVETQ